MTKRLPDNLREVQSRPGFDDELSEFLTLVAEFRSARNVAHMRCGDCLALAIWLGYRRVAPRGALDSGGVV